MRSTHLLLAVSGVLAAVAAVTAACTSDDITDDPADGGSTDGPAPTSDGTAPAPDGAPPSDAGPKPDPNVVRELYFRELAHTDDAGALASGLPVISRSGNRVAFSTGTGTETDENPNRVFVVDADGSNLEEIDHYKTGVFAASFVAISDDGKLVVSSDSTQVRVVDATSGTLKGAVTLDNNVVLALAVTNAGDVFFQAARDSNELTPTATPLQRGLYKMKSDASGLTQILSPQIVAPLVSLADPNQVFPFAGCGTMLTVSSDGSKVYSVVQANAGQAIISAGGTASVTLAPLTLGNKLVNGIAVSGDGTKLAYWIASDDPSGAEVDVVATDGSGKKKLLGAGAGNGCGQPLTMSDDGKLVSFGSTALVLPVSGDDPWPVLATTGFFSGDPAFIGTASDNVSMSGDGKRFVYRSDDGKVGRQIGLVDVNPTDVGGAPRVSEPKVSPGTIPHDLSASATVTVKVSGAPIRVGGVAFLKGAVDSNAVHADKVLTADGGAYANDTVNASTNAEPGPRILRVKAEGATAGGRAATALDFMGLAVQ